MLTFLALMCHSRTVRPLLWWVAALFVYVVAPVPQGWVLVIIVGLGVALTVTLTRLREKTRHVTDRAEWGINLAERLTQAVEDRIRGEYALPEQQPPALTAPVAVYDPGALLSAIVALLAAEGIPTNAAPALPACAQLLAWQCIGIQPGIPALAAMTLATTLPQGAQRQYRVMPAGLLAAVVRVVLTADQAMPANITTDAADALIVGAEHVLYALGIDIDDRAAGGLQAWPVIAELVASAPLPPPADPYRYQ